VSYIGKIQPSSGRANVFIIVLQPPEPPQLEQYIYQDIVGGQRLDVRFFVGKLRSSGISPEIADLENGSEERVRRKKEREVGQELLLSGKSGFQRRGC
jgi:hypothetical protein